MKTVNSLIQSLFITAKGTSVHEVIFSFSGSQIVVDEAVNAGYVQRHQGKISLTANGIAKAKADRELITFRFDQDLRALQV